MKLGFSRASAPRQLRQPKPACIPQMERSSIAARYQAARVGGDYFDFVVSPSGRMVFVLADIAGKREEALDIAAAVQERLQESARELFAAADLNENEAVTELLIRLNRAIMGAAGGVRAAPAFLGSYDERFGTLAYINAGHTPALLRDSHGITRLEAGGFPLGLFSHATHDTQMTVLQPGAALLVASKGLVEMRAGSKEFGLERLSNSLKAAKFQIAAELCGEILEAVKKFGETANRRPKQPVSQNDATVLALVRAG